MAGRARAGEWGERQREALGRARTLAHLARVGAALMQAAAPGVASDDGGEYGRAMRLVVAALAARHGRYAQLAVPREDAERGEEVAGRVAARWRELGYGAILGESHTAEYAQLTVWPLAGRVGEG